MTMYESRLLSIRGHHFYPGLISADSTIVDLGAHLGDFSHELSNRFGCKCYAVEAQPALCSRIKENHLIKKFNYAITSTNGSATLHIAKNLEGSSILNLPDDMTDGSVIVDGVTFETFLNSNKITLVDLLKSDIEGAEIELFRSMSDSVIRRIKQITIEFHDFIKELNCFNEVKEIKERLMSLGFFCIVFSKSDNTDVLFINREKCGISNLECFYLKYIVKYYRGFLRVIKRKIPIQQEEQTHEP